MPASHDSGDDVRPCPFFAPIGSDSLRRDETSAMMGAEPPMPQLCVVFAATDEAAGVHRLAKALDQAHLACVVIAGPDGHSAPDAAQARPLIALCQERDVAALVWQDASLARTLKADGVHLPWSRTLAQDYGAAREILDSRAVVGVDAGRSRHDAMTLGEAGASYVGFGAPAALKDLESARERRAGLVAWWSEIFEIPCVAFDVEDADAAVALAEADFLSVHVASDDDVDRLRTIAAVVSRREVEV
jgi:thiamine-phosphate pyrophosphorylase